MAIRNFAPRYCNTCIHFDLEACAKAGGAALYCEQREITTNWDDRMCVLYMPVSDSTRQARRLIVEQLHKDKKRRETSADTKNAAEGGG